MGAIESQPEDEAHTQAEPHPGHSFCTSSEPDRNHTEAPTARLQSRSEFIEELKRSYPPYVAANRAWGILMRLRALG